MRRNMIEEGFERVRNQAVFLVQQIIAHRISLELILSVEDNSLFAKVLRPKYCSFMEDGCIQNRSQESKVRKERRLGNHRISLEVMLSVEDNSLIAKVLRPKYYPFMEDGCIQSRSQESQVWKERRLRNQIFITDNLGRRLWSRSLVLLYSHLQWPMQLRTPVTVSSAGDLVLILQTTVLHRVKLFVWKLIRNAIPTKHALNMHHLPVKAASFVVVSYIQRASWFGSELGLRTDIVLQILILRNDY